MPRRRSLDPDATRAAIRTAAEQLFTDHGFAGTSIADIAAAAQVPKSLISHHFGSKEALWNTVKHDRFASYATQQRERLLQNPASGRLLIDSLRSYFLWLREHPDFLRLMAWRDLERNPALSGPEADLIELGRQRMREAQQAGILRADIDTDAALLAIFAMLEAWFTSPKRTCFPVADAPDADGRFLDTVLSLLTGGILARPEAP
jgi:TetR/AcrR family transcriptional regulator